MEYYNTLSHAGIKGMKWGVRRYQNEDGTLTTAGRERYNYDVPTTRRSSNPYTRALSRNGLVAVNRLSQMAIVGGLTAASSAVARKRGKKASAAAMTVIGKFTVAGLAGAMVVDLAKNNGGDDMQHSELYHAGIKGMKWGVRRYQNKDGTLTAEGKKRYNREADRGNYDEVRSDGTRYRTTKKGNTESIQADPYRYAKEDNEALRGVLNESRGLTSSLKSVNEASIRRTKNNRPKMDLSNMSDKDMRDQINRAMLEKQYNDMFAPQKSTRGREHVNEILDGVGSVLGVGASAVGLAVGILTLREKLKGG
jgi:hypothetical protein